MEVTFLAVIAILCSIPSVSGTACIHNCLCDDDKCSACSSVERFSEIIPCKKCPLGCLSCEGQNLDICTACTEKHALRNSDCFPCPVGCETCEYVEQRHVCNLCERGYYLTGTVCTSCFSHCMICRSLNDCKDCNEFCISCAPNCVTCTSYSSCTKCRPGFYGESCNNTCSNGCRELKCDKQNGNCSCKQEWNGPLCDEVCPESCQFCSLNATCNRCKPGYYGYLCEHRCSTGCSDNLCFKNTGECIACKTNFVGGNCSSCKEGYFGQNCQGMCPAKCRLCSSKASCTICRSSFFGVTCEKKCSDRCTDSGCERNTGTCLQCKPNFTGVSCENCSEDFEGDMCQGCVSGKYGLNCSDICPSTCKTNVCHQYNGNCLTGCMPGMFGFKCENWCPANCAQCTADISCQTCKTGYRGELCSLRCPYGCNGGCYHDGTCIACAEGSYGNLCNMSCSTHCNRGQCNKTGFCYDCISGHYGYHCEQVCSQCCNGTCSRDGSCEHCNNYTVRQFGGIVAPVLFVVLGVPVIVTLAVIIIKRKKLERCRSRDEELVMYSRMDMRQDEEIQLEDVATSDSLETGIVAIGSYVYENTETVPVQAKHASEKTLNALAPLDAELDDEKMYDEKEDDNVNIQSTVSVIYNAVRHSKIMTAEDDTNIFLYQAVKKNQKILFLYTSRNSDAFSL